MRRTHYFFGLDATGSVQLAAPINGQAIAASSTSMTVTANSVGGAASYRLYRDTSSTGTFTTQIGGVLATPSFTDNVLTASTTYYYRWQAMGNNTTTTDSVLGVVFSGITAAAPAAGPVAIEGDDTSNIIYFTPAASTAPADYGIEPTV